MNQIIDGRWPIALAGLAVLLLGGWTMYQEVSPNLRGGTTAIGRVLAMPDGNAPIGLALMSQHRALLDCELIMRSERSLEMQYLQADERQRAVDNCGQMAGNILARSPANSFAWLVKAATAIGQGNVTEFNDALLRSYLTGPNEGWIASLRLRMAEAHIDELTGEARDRHDLDLALVASDALLAAPLARQYLTSGPLRGRMKEVLETMPPADQQQFLRAVQTALTASGR